MDSRLRYLLFGYDQYDAVFARQFHDDVKSAEKEMRRLVDEKVCASARIYDLRLKKTIKRYGRSLKRVRIKTSD